jgi:hypothetical protein
MGQRLTLLTFFISAFISISVFGYEVQSVSKHGQIVRMKHLGKEKWSSGDWLCISVKAEQLGCGVVQSTRKGSISVRLEEPLEKQLTPQMKVKLDRIERTVAAPEPAVTAVSTESVERTHILLGVSFVQPLIQFERAMSEHLAIGLFGNYLDYRAGIGLLKGFGMHGLLSFYPKQLYRGFSFNIGVGFQNYVVTLNAVEQNASSPSVLSYAGWRWPIGSGFSLSIGAGVQYLWRVTPSNSALGFSGVIPMGILALGLGF